MRQYINLSSDPWSLEPFQDAGALRRFYEKFGCDGIELILCGEAFEDKIMPGMVGGLHLVFYPEWISLWREDYEYLTREFGSRDMWQGFYAVKSGPELMAYYRHELDLAQKLGVQYVVFHMGDNALDEFFTLEPRRTPQQQVDESCAFLNELFADGDYSFDLLLENMWLGCMTLEDPALTRRALEQIRYPRTGLMLDTGHLLATNPSVQTLEEGCQYIHQVLDAHGEMAQRIWGVHLHASLSGEYFSTLPLPPPPHELDYLERYALANDHLRKVDLHLPFVSPALPGLIRRIAPKYLCHEIYHGATLAEWESKLRAQTDCLAGRPVDEAQWQPSLRPNYTFAPFGQQAALQCKARWGAIAKPLGSLGRLEDALVRIAGLTGNASYTLARRGVLVMCADNGVVCQGVTQTGPEVTAVVAANITRGDASVCRMADVANADVTAVDMGMLEELALPGLLNRRIAAGTGDISAGPAMTRAQAQQAIHHGVLLVRQAKQQGYSILCTGEMGIGNTTTSAAVASVLLGCPPALATGRGAGLSTTGLRRKIQVIEEAIRANNPDPQDPLDVLAKLGGFDIAGLVGVFAGGGIYRIPILLDGLISSVAALVASRLYPACRTAMLASHVSAEPAGQMLLDALELQPLITAGMFLGEGTGAVAALPLLDMAYAVYNHMPTFQQINIESYQPLP